MRPNTSQEIETPMGRASEEFVLRHLKRNFTLGLLNGTIFYLGDALMSDSLVLPLFFSSLTDSKFLIGLIPAIRQGGWFLPQLLVSRHVQNWPREKFVYAYSSVFRSLALGILAVSALTVLGNPPLLLLLAFSLIVIQSLASGVSGLPFMDVVGKTIPVTRRGTFFGARNFFGGIMAFGAGLLVKYVLDRSGYTFPTNFGLLFGLSWMAQSLSFLLFIEMVEPAGTVSPRKESLSRHLKQALAIIVEDQNYRRFIFFRLAYLATAMAVPFYILYARQRLAISGGMAGLYLSLTTGVTIASNLLWSYLSDRKGNRVLLRMVAALGTLSPVMALLLAQLTGFVAKESLGYLFSLVFVLMGVADAGALIGCQSYLLEISPPANRSVYVGLANTIFSMAFFATALGGIIVDIAGFNVLFLLAATFYLLALIGSSSLVEPRSI